MNPENEEEPPAQMEGAGAFDTVDQGQTPESARPTLPPLTEADVVRRAMLNTMRLYNADDLHHDPQVFKQTVLNTLELVKAQSKSQGVVLANHEHTPLSVTKKPSPLHGEAGPPRLPPLGVIPNVPIEEPEQNNLRSSKAALDEKADQCSGDSETDSDEEDDDWAQDVEHREHTSRMGKLLVPVVTSRVFARTVLIAIGLNCVQLSEYFQLHPYTHDKEHWLYVTDSVIEVLLWVIFSAEFVLKFLALGYKLYFSNNWNCLDAFILLSGYIGFIPGVGELTFFRVLRIVRPLRIVGRLKGMKVILQTINASLRPLFDTLLLSCLLFFIFGIVGLQLFQGALNRRCFTGDAASGYTLDTTISRLCGGEYSCPDTHTCIYSDQTPNFSITNFNNIPDTFLTIFVAITLEGWTDVLYQLQDSYSWWPATIYFISLILLGSLFTLNLALAVISDTYADMIGDEEEEEEEEVIEANALTVEITSSDLSPTSPTGGAPEKHTFRHWTYTVAVAPWFENLITVIIILNTLTLSMEYVDVCSMDGIYQACAMPTGYADALSISNYIFIGCFTVEVGIKMFGLGWRAYFQERYNIFDLFVVIVSYIELLAAGNGSLSVIRTFRLARVLKLVKNWTSLRDLLQTILDTLPAVGYLSILLLLFMFISAIAGMAFFGNKFQPPALEAEPRENFDNFFKAMLTVFQILTGENWNTVLYDAMEVSSSGFEWAAAIFIVGMFASGNFLLLNLFLAILLQNFGETEAPDMSFDGCVRFLCGWCTETTESTEAKVSPEEEETEDNPVKMNHSCAAVIALNKVRKQTFLNKIAREDDVEDTSGPTLYGKSLCLFEPENKFREWLAVAVNHRIFDLVVFVCIGLSSLTLAMDAPDLDPDSELKAILDGMDYGFVSVFFIEMAMKCVVMGFLFTPHAYLKDGWNVIDFIIVVSSIASIILDDSALGVLRVLRALRAFRPLRMIKRAPGLKCVVDAIFGCLPGFINISLVCTLVYLVFSIMGVGLWAGKFWSCNDTSVSGVTQCVGTYTVSGVSTAREWSNARQNFDNVLNGLLTLFEVASLELWLDIMYSAMDAPSELGDQPRQNQQGAAALYFVVFIIIGSFLMLNLFVGAVVDNFSKVKEEAGRSAVMTEEQVAFVKSIRTMLNNKPSTKAIAPQGARGSAPGGSFFYKIRLGCFKFSQYNWRSRKQTKLDESPTFDTVILLLIVLNVLVMSAYTWVQPTFPTLASDTVASYEFQKERTLNVVLEILNTVFVWLFVAEACVKLLALGWTQYFSSGMNIFDFGVVMVSTVGFIINLALSDVNSSVLSVITVIRALRVVRVLRLVTRVKGVKRLLETLLYTLPGLCNVSLLVFMVLFIYTVLGMNFFGKQSFNTGPFMMYNEHANFRNFYYGYVTLFRMSTGESWNGIMHDCMVDTGAASWVFFVSYMIIGSYLMFNLLVAILLDEFSMAQAQENHKVPPDMIEAFSLVWRDLDPKATHFIPCDMLPQLLKRLEKPLGAGKAASAAEVMLMMQDVNLTVSNGQAHFVETFMALVLATYEVETMDPQVYNSIVDDLLRSFPTLAEVDPKAERDAIATFAAIKLQSVARGFKSRKEGNNSWAATLEELGVSPSASFSQGFISAMKPKKDLEDLDVNNLGRPLQALP
eukprot:TRINITY_DN10202_c0_g1_i1.p1 TRINITY_DN10202_c0_g1~~TRINITY_DN10202_c0_g1_i1.p1  ORF type:complete len:1644 (+),score=363.32 TRINITY_DN10202_c0_g1_i1:42-4973(+)